MESDFATEAEYCLHQNKTAFLPLRLFSIPLPFAFPVLGPSDKNLKTHRIRIKAQRLTIFFFKFESILY